MPSTKLDPRSARQHLQTFQFTNLFIEDLGWNHPERAKPMLIENGGLSYQAREIYDLTIPEFQHILSTFPLVDGSVKSQTLNAYRELVKLGKFASNSVELNRL